MLNAGPGGLLPVELWGGCRRSRHVWLDIWYCGHSGRLDHMLVGVEDITLERQAE